MSIDWAAITPRSSPKPRSPRWSCHPVPCRLRQSFLKRENKVEQLAEGNLPLGVFQQVKAQPIVRGLQDGDYLFMMSDGVIDAFSEQGYETAVSRAIADMQEQNPGELAEHLLRMALIAASAAGSPHK